MIIIKKSNFTRMMIKAGFTKAGLAKKAGISQSYLSLLLSGRGKCYRQPPKNFMQRSTATLTTYSKLRRWNKMSNIPRMLTVRQTAEETGLSERFIRRLCTSGEIVTVKSGCKYLINLDRLIDFLNGQGKSEDTEPKQCGVIRRVG